MCTQGPRFLKLYSCSKSGKRASLTSCLRMLWWAFGTSCKQEKNSCLQIFVTLSWLEFFFLQNSSCKLSIQQNPVCKMFARRCFLKTGIENRLVDYQTDLPNEIHLHNRIQWDYNRIGVAALDCGRRGVVETSHQKIWTRLLEGDQRIWTHSCYSFDLTDQA